MRGRGVRTRELGRVLPLLLASLLCLGLLLAALSGTTLSRWTLATPARRMHKASAGPDDHVLRLLLVGDIHGAMANVEALCRDQAGQHFDYVFVNGDLVNIPGSVLAGPGAAAAGEPELPNIALQMEALQSLLPAPAADGGGTEDAWPQLIYVPGNHDPPQLLDTSTELNLGGALNLHEKHVRLAPGLRLVGWGGSVPSVQDGKQVWVGYPWQMEEQVRTAWAVFWRVLGCPRANLCARG
jgi:predicted phosphodiesterase